MNDKARDLNDLYYFVQVVEHGGFAPAGRALDMPKSKLSRRIALLEARLGMRLIQRSTRRFTVTDVGQTYYAHCRAMLVEADAADEAIALLHEEPRGIVRVSCPIVLLDSLVGTMIAAFMVACPRVEIHLEATNRRVDVVGEGIDVAIRVRPPPLEDSDLALRVLAERGQCLVASPALLREHGAPAVPADLARVPSLDHGAPQSAHVWRLRGPDGAHAEIHHQPRFVTGGMLARAAAVAGVGIVQLPTMMVRDEVARGELVTVLPDCAAPRDRPCGVRVAPGIAARGARPARFFAERFAELEPD